MLCVFNPGKVHRPQLSRLDIVNRIMYISPVGARHPWRGSSSELSAKALAAVEALREGGWLFDNLIPAGKRDRHTGDNSPGAGDSKNFD